MGVAGDGAGVSEGGCGGVQVGGEIAVGGKNPTAGGNSYLLLRVESRDDQQAADPRESDDADPGAQEGGNCVEEDADGGVEAKRLLFEGGDRGVGVAAVSERSPADLALFDPRRAGSGPSSRGDEETVPVEGLGVFVWKNVELRGKNKQSHHSLFFFK